MNKIFYKIISLACLFSFSISNIAQTKETFYDIKNSKNQIADILYYDAIMAKTTQDFGSAFDLLRYVNQLDSTNTAISNELGTYYSLFHDQENAYKFLKKASDGFPENVFYGTSYSLISMQMGNNEEAIDRLNYLAEKNPSSSIYLYLAEAYKREEKYQEAIDNLTKAEELLGLNEQISLEKYDLYKLMGEEKRAFAEMDKYLNKHPEEPNYYILMGDLYMQSNDTIKARSYYEQAKEINPTNPYIIFSLANFYDKINKPELAKQELELAILNPDMDVDTKLNIIMQHASEQHKTDSIDTSSNELFAKLIEMHPLEPKLNAAYGNLLMVQGKNNEAREQFRIFADANPKNPIGWEQLLMTSFPDSVKLTIAISKEAINNLPTQPQFYFYNGLANYLDKNYDEALNALTVGLQYVPEEQTALKSDFMGQIGDLYHQTGDRDKAYASYDEALRYNPNNIGVLNNYSYFLSLDGEKLDKAERMISNALKLEPLNPTYLDTYGWVLFKQGAFELSRSYLEKALEYSKNSSISKDKNNSENEDSISSEILEHYGDVLYKTGDKEKAIKYWRMAKEASLKTGIKEENLILDYKIKKGEYFDKIPDEELNSEEK